MTGYVLANTHFVTLKRRITFERSCILSRSENIMLTSSY